MVCTISSVGGGAVSAVSIDYAMKKIAGKWAVVNIMWDYQSLAQNVAAQMQAVLKTGSCNDLVAQMESRLKQER
jgi:ABC-type transporter MlaC component